MLSVQIVYSVQLNCTYINYTEAAATCSAAQQHRTFTVQILYKTVQSATELYLQKLHKICPYMFSCKTAQHIYCTNCTVCNWNVLTVITQKLPLHVQLNNSTAHLLYNSTVCNWTVLPLITPKLQLNVQFHNSTAHLLNKYCTNCTICKLNCTENNYTEAAATY